MEIKITNVYDNDALPGRGLKGGGGECFHFAVGDRQVLFDTGWRGGKLIHNMKKLGINPDGIEKLVLSHGHHDHTGGLRSFLKARTTENPLQIPSFFKVGYEREERSRMRRHGIRVNIV